MKKNVLILEDDQSHFERVRTIFSKYDIGSCPSSDAEYKSLAKILREFGESRSEESLQKIQQKLSSCSFDFIILDRSFTSRLDDKSGLILEEKILKVNYPGTEICYLSNFPKDLNADNYIEKDDYVSWEANLYNKVISKLLKDNPLQVVKSKTEEGIPDSLTIDDRQIELNQLKIRTSLPKGIALLAEKERFKLLPAVSFLIDSFIKYVFYVSLVALFVYGPAYILWSLFKYSDNPILIAEHAFIVFLPFLIACGFYVFYIKSLSPYIRQKPIDKDDFESSSTLMNLAKKLFVSSLLSYLFIKLIELLLLEGENNIKLPPFAEKYNLDSSIVLIYFVIGFIIILLLYYIYIDKNHNNKKDS